MCIFSKKKKHHTMLIYENVCLTFIQKKNYSICYSQVKKTARSCIVSVWIKSVSIEKRIQFFEVCLKLKGPVSLP